MKKNDYIKILEKYKNKYTFELIKIRETYEKNIQNISNELFVELNSRYRNLICDLIKDVVLEFKAYYKTSFIVLLNGSLARKTNTIYSDIDINYLTLNDDRSIYQLEDKINYILKEVLLFRGKDKIHSMVVYLPLKTNINYDFISNNKYPIEFSDGVIYSCCRKNAEKLMYESYNSTRNLYDLICYLNNHDNQDELNEWTYCYKFIDDSDLMDIFFKERECYRKTNNISLHIESAINKIVSDTFFLNENDCYLKNSDIKEAYKNSVLFNVYNILAIIYRINLKIKNFDLDNFINNDTLITKKYYLLLIDYLQMIQLLQFILMKCDIELSSHSDEYLNIDKINSIYNSITGSNNIIKDFNEKKQYVYKVSCESLNKLKEMNYEE